jgi:ABC-type Fe3+-hydroxamate transport system substrate-binding protein
MLFTDQLNNTIESKSFPKRVISLVPSQSELLWDLGLREELIGIERVGGTKTLNIEKIRALQPDLIIGNKEENEQSQILELQKEFTVWMSDIYTLEDSLTMIEKVGALVNRVDAAKTITNNIQTSFLNLLKVNKSVLYFIWREPYMAAGNATFIGDMLKRIGFENKLSDEQARYPELNLDEIKLLNPELIFLSSEPYPFKANHIKELQDILPYSKIVLVDGELFSWYGSRLQKSVAYFNELIKIL